MIAHEASGARHVLEWLQKRWIAIAVTIVIVMLHLAAAAVTIRHSNQDSTASDQGAEMWLAATSRDDVLPQRTDGVRHPLWSWIARCCHTENQETFFTRGKWLNTSICAVFLLVLGISLAGRCDALAIANLLLLCSLGILLVRGTYFQPEPIYYILSFLALLLGWKLLGEPRLVDSVIFGAASGLAYLAKPSLGPLLGAFALAWIVRRALAFRETWPARGLHFGGALISVAIFAVLLTPLAMFSARHFGKPFFNYPQYWMWMDDFEAEAWPFQDRYPGREQLRHLPKDETPSIGWYFRRHTLADAAQRLSSGSKETFRRFFFPEQKLPLRAIFWRSAKPRWEQPLAHRGVYLIFLACLSLALAALAWPEFRAGIGRPEVFARAAFAILILAAYTLLYGWYWPIGRGDRFMGSLWMPAVFLVIWSAWQLRALDRRPMSGLIYLGVHGLVFTSLVIQAGAMFLRFSNGVYLVTRN